jgi:hypothetical protein
LRERQLHGGEAGIRTLGGVAPTTIFETVPFNRSGTSPRDLYYKPIVCPNVHFGDQLLVAGDKYPDGLT